MKPGFLACVLYCPINLSCSQAERRRSILRINGHFSRIYLQLAPMSIQLEDANLKIWHSDLHVEPESQITTLSLRHDVKLFEMRDDLESWNLLICTTYLWTRIEIWSCTIKLNLVPTFTSGTRLFMLRLEFWAIDGSPKARISSRQLRKPLILPPQPDSNLIFQIKSSNLSSSFTIGRWIWEAGWELDRSRKLHSMHFKIRAHALKTLILALTHMPPTQH